MDSPISPPLAGSLRFIRYAFMPNRLRYCGGDEVVRRSVTAFNPTTVAFTDAVIGFLDTYGRATTSRMAGDVEVGRLREIPCTGVILEEMDTGRHGRQRATPRCTSMT